MRTKLAHLRAESGVSALETAVAAFIVIVMAAIGVDMTILTMGFTMLDTAARDAARAAGSQQTADNALAAAKTQMSTHQTDGVFIHQPTLTGTSSPYFVYEDFSGKTPANAKQTPYVVVTCSEEIHLPVNIPFFGVNMSDWTKNGYFTLSRRYTFPIVKMKYYSS